VVGDDKVDDLAWAVPPSEPAGRGVRVATSFLFYADSDERLPERPAAAASPGRIVEVQAAAECRDAVTGEERPCHDQVAGWIANGSAPEVDDRVQCPG